ncbi:MAG: 4-oxalocrotonate tautomerase family protein [Leptospirillia bacterium]
MPFVNVKVAGALNGDQKRKIAAGITRLMEEVAGKPPAATYVVIEEVPRSNWAKSGELLESPD